MRHATRRARFIAVAMASLAGCRADATSQVPTGAMTILPVTSSHHGGAPSASATVVPLADVDMDADGVRDADDRCPDAAAGEYSWFDKLGCPGPSSESMSLTSSTVGILIKIEFEASKHEVPASAESNIEVLVGMLHGGLAQNLEVRGHCESGEQLFLAKRRAKAVCDELVRHGAPSSRLLIASDEVCEPPARGSRQVEFELR